MISDIYFPTVTFLKNYEEQPFYDFVVTAFPSCIQDHLPKGMTFISIEYKKDMIIDAFLEMLVSANFNDIELLKETGLEVETGIYCIQLEGNDDFTKKPLPSVEFVFQNLHESYSFISSYQFYLDEDEIRFFCKLHTFKSDVDDTDDFIENLKDYTYLLASYFYDGVIPETYLNEVAKWMLIKGRL